MISFKKILICSLVASFLLPFELSQTEAASTTLSKTVEFFAGQDASVHMDGSQFSFVFSNVIIPETNPVIKSAIIEISGVSYNSSGDQKINVDLEQNDLPPGTLTEYILAQNVKPKSFNIKHNVLGTINPLVSAYTLYLAGNTVAGTRSFSIFSAKLVLTYEYSASSADLLKTNKFFIGQETNNLPPGPSFVSKNFTLTIPEQSPVIQSVFVEIGGSVKGSGSGYFQAGIVPEGTVETYNNSYSLDLGAVNTNSKFLIRHNAFSEINFTEPGSKNYTLYFKSSDFNIDLWNAKLIITYKYSEQIGGLPPKGELISSTFDTWNGIESHKGVAYNSIFWTGDLKGGVKGQVRLQFAASNCAGGQSNYPDCNIGTWGDANTPYMAYDESSGNCSSSYYYDMLPSDPPKEIMCAVYYNNKQFFRYKVTICSAANCSDSGNINPEVTGVVVNWAP